MQGLPVSPLAPDGFPALAPLKGVKLSSASCGIKKNGAVDLLLVECAAGTQVAGVFTRSQTRSAAVDWCKSALASGKARALLVNSGNANAFTGAAGMEAVKATAQSAADILGCEIEEVFTASTGVIGEPLPYEKITSAMPSLAHSAIDNAWEEAAKAIMTTDTFAKAATRSFLLNGVRYHIHGIAKGSGMIAPDMATMLGFLFTDAPIASSALQAVLSQVNEESFNSITVDSDTSTSDTVLLFATGKAPLFEDHKVLVEFESALREVMIELAQLIVRDGEGARKFITVKVTGARDAIDAKQVALSVANSPLVKTAIAGEDANWGRLVMAAGKTGAYVERDRLTIAVGGITLTRDGQRAAEYDEAPVAAHMKGQEIDLHLDLGLGDAAWTVWTCDLTEGYIKINADYRS